MDLQLGDLVQCRENRYTEGLGISHLVGMAAELRRNHVRILFDADNQSIWLPKASVNRIVLPPTDSPTFLERLSWIIHYLEAEGCELEVERAGHYRYTAVCGNLSLDQILGVQVYTRFSLVELTVVPRGMSRVGLQITFRKETDGAMAQ